MKKVLILLAFILSASIYAQIGIKAGLTYNADDGLYKTAENAYTNKGEGNAGFHVGIYRKFNLVNVYILPELWYVSYKNEFTDPYNQSIDLDYKRIDLPVSVGKNLFGIAHVQAGPVFSFYFEDDIDVVDISEIEQDDVALALQVGAGVSLNKLDLNIRYDFPLGDRETKWIRDNNFDFSTESSPKLLHVSLGYRF